MHSIAAYPNPASGMFVIEGSNSTYGDNTAWSLHDLTGKLTLNGNLRKAKGMERFRLEIDANTLTKGVYIFTIFNGAKTENIKIVVQ